MEKILRLLSLIIGVVFLPISYFVSALSVMTFDAPGSVSDPKAWTFFFIYNLIVWGIPGILIFVGLRYFNSGKSYESSPPSSDVVINVDHLVEHGNQLNSHTVLGTNNRAHFRDRLIAIIIDYLILSIPLGIIFFMVIYSENQPNNHGNYLSIFLLILMSIIIYFVYFIFLLWKMKGQTIGKKLMKIVVTNIEGECLTLKQIILREFYARGIPIILGIIVGQLSKVWYLTYLRALSNDQLALHDTMAKTQVIKL